jgi:hypothetical protein
VATQYVESQRNRLIDEGGTSEETTMCASKRRLLQQQDDQRRFGPKAKNHQVSLHASLLTLVLKISDRRWMLFSPSAPTQDGKIPSIRTGLANAAQSTLHPSAR